MNTLILSSSVVKKHLSLKLAIDMVDYVFHERGAGHIVMPPKIHTDMSGIGHESWCNAMPAYINNLKVGGIKWIGGFGDNPAHNLPYIMGVILLTEPHSGFVKAIMDGRLISDYRTGASAAIFSRHLQSGPVDDILIVGAGAQGQIATRCLHYEHPAARLHLYDLRQEKAELFKTSMHGTSLAEKIIVCADLEQAARTSGLIVLLTTAQEPFLKNDWISSGATVLGMGSYQQIEDSFILSCDKIIPDSWEQAKGRGELKSLYAAERITDAHCSGELSQLIAAKKPGRENGKERILGLPVGLGAHDVAIGNIVYEAAKADGEGIEIKIQEI